MIIIVLIVAILCMVIANYMWQRERNRKEEEHERRMERFERLMETLRKPNSDKKVQESDTIPPPGRTEENPKSS
jgi:Flp pilus assembly protein TadB